MNDSPPSIRPAGTRFTLLIVWVFLLPMAASACPICNTATGQQVRAGIFGNDFWSTLLIVISPFPVLLLALAAYHFGWPRFGNGHGKTTQLESTHQPNAPKL